AANDAGYRHGRLARFAFDVGSQIEHGVNEHASRCLSRRERLDVVADDEVGDVSRQRFWSFGNLSSLAALEMLQHRGGDLSATLVLFENCQRVGKGGRVG